MDCSRISSLFSAGLDHELDQESQAGFADHLEQCPACRREWRLFRATVARVRALEPLTPPLGILSGIQARLDRTPPPGPLARLAAYWRRLDFTVSLPAAVATVALAVIMAFLAKNEAFFQYRPAPEQVAAVNGAVVGPGLKRPGNSLAETIMAATSRRDPALFPHSPFDTMPAHPPAIRVPVMQRPDVLMVLHAAPPEILPHLFLESVAYAHWRVEHPERHLLLVDLPAGDLALLRRMLAPYPVAVAPVAALSPHFTANKDRLRVAIKAR